jgi:cobalt-zinc-cadmium efflux system protein
LSEHYHSAFGVATKLKYGIIITAVILVLEVAGGILSNSLALLSDAGHVLADGVALTLSWYGVRQAARPSSSRMTFGYHRVGVIIAIVNAVSILAIAGIILFEAYQRFYQQPEINSVMMLVIAVIGLAANIFVASWLHREQGESLNIKSAFWHAIGDALASVGVIAGAIIIMLTKLYWVDAAVSVLISVIIIFAAWGIFREGTRILLEAVPGDINVNEVLKAMKSIPEIRDVHDLHIWSISSNLHSLSCHILVDDCSISQAESVQQQIEKIVREKFGIGHTTIQTECTQCSDGGLFCKMTVGDRRHGHQQS